jgi:pantetheine-phosphate adenylyltransferase
MMSRRADVALFPGTFDPFTNGHLDLATRAAGLFPRVVIAVAQASTKTALFPAAERVEMIKETLATTAAASAISVTTFEGLVVDCAKDVGATVMIRGLRAVSDFEFEFQMALMNRKLSPHLEIVYLMPDVRYTYLNATLVKEVARLGGDVHDLLPAPVSARLFAKLGRKAPSGA